MIDIRSISFKIGGFSMEDLSLSVGAKEYFVLVGKPGSGKTLLMECVAGLRRILSGTIRIAGRDVTCLEPRLRGIGYVPQDLALFPHLSVERNIGFGLKAMGLSRKEASVYVRWAADLLRIEHLLGRTVEGLSGGERQRAALARALAPRPPVLLLDEPLSALDEETRTELCAEMKRVQRETGTTVLHICHDLEEMSALADRMAMICGGRVVQVGSPEEISRAPSDPNVAGFMRLGTVLRGEAQSVAGDVVIELGGGLVVQAKGRTSGTVDFLVRSESVLIKRGSVTERSPNSFAGRFLALHRAGPIVLADAEIGTGTRIRAAMLPRDAEPLSILSSGDPVAVSFPPSAVYVFPGTHGNGAHSVLGEPAESR